MRKQGFTLVELLAVLVVLAVILAITVPAVSNIIRSSTMKAFENDAKMVLNAIRLKEIEIDNLNPEEIDETNIDAILGLSNANYDDLEITIYNNEKYIAVRGRGKWAGFSACGTFRNIRVNEGACANDFEDPVITLLGDDPVTINVGDTYVDAGATATDDTDEDIADKIVVTGEVNVNQVGTYILSYDVTDNSGRNAITVTRTVHVIDTNNPVVTFGTNGNTTYAQTRSTTVTVSDAGGIDNSSLKYLWNTSTTEPSEGSFSTTFTSGGAISSPAGVTGGYYLWILAKDTQNNTTIARSEVFNLDNTAPSITVDGSNPVYLPIGATYTDAGATASDEHSGVGAVTPTGTVNVNNVGTYTITYNVTDNAGNAATPATRTVYVIDYIPIYNQTQLAQVCSGTTVSINGHNYTMNASGKYKLMNDITLTGSWTSICSSFTGTFDGDNYTISNLSMYQGPTNSSLGFIRQNGGTGTIKNLNLSGTITQSTICSYSGDPNCVSSFYTGMLTAYNNGTIQNSSSTGTITQNGEALTNVDSKLYTGMLVGYNNGTIQNSSSSGTINLATRLSFQKYLGGLVGYNNSGKTINSSNAAVNINTEAGNGSVTLILGGLVGYNNSGTIDKSYATGNINGYNYQNIISGGLVGLSSGYIYNSYATGNVLGTSTGGYFPYAGGLVGNLDGYIYNSYATGTVSATISPNPAYNSSIAGGIVGRQQSSSGYIYNSYAIGNVTSNAGDISSSKVGGLIGEINGTIANTFWNKSAVLLNYTTPVSVPYPGYVGTATYVVGLTSNEMLGTSTPSFTGYNGATYNNVLTALNAYVSGSGVTGLVTWNRNSSINNGYPYLVGVTPSS